MHNMLFTKKFVLFFLLLIPGIVFALPGVDDYLPTGSGQYVYYRDYTFKEETYIGFLQYDPSTYSLRYFSPNSQYGTIDVEISITLDSSKDFIELTGERISNPSQENIDYVNYLHDLLYELNARRQKITPELLKTTHKTNDVYAQFGGEVILTYDFYIPIFNLTKIQNSEGDTLFEAVCVNCILDASDNSFNAFKGYPEISSLKKISEKSISSFSKKRLDKKWNSSVENLWTLNNDAIVFSNKSTYNPEDFSETNFTIFDFFSRSYLFTNSNNYCYLPKAIIKKEPNYFLISSLQFNAEKNNWFQDIKIVQLLPNYECRLSGLTVFYDYYASNKSYFDTIVKRIIEK